MFVDPFVVRLGQRVDDGHGEVGDHQQHELLEDPRKNIRLLSRRMSGRRSVLASVQLLLLLGQEVLEGALQPGDHGHVRHRRLNQRLVEGQNDEQLLQVHLDHGLADQRGPEERPERHEKVPAGDPGQVEQRVGYRSAGQNAEKSHSFHQLLDAQFGAVEHVLQHTLQRLQSGAKKVCTLMREH